MENSSIEELSSKMKDIQESEKNDTPQNGVTKILFAFDSFKNSISAESIHEYLNEEIKQSPQAKQIATRFMTLSDGGEGFLTSLSEGEIIQLIPKFNPINTNNNKMNILNENVQKNQEIDENIQQNGFFGPDGTILPSVLIRKAGNTIFMEMAKSSGIELVDIPDCLIFSSYGTGQVIREILLQFMDVEEIVIGVGGTATSDAGIGCLFGIGKDVILHECSIKKTPPIELFEKIEWIDEMPGDNDKSFNVRKISDQLPEGFFTGQDLAMLEDIHFTEWTKNILLGKSNSIDEDRYNQLEDKHLHNKLYQEEIVEFLKMRLSKVRLCIASDVRTPFCGKIGSVSVFSKQKGASSKHIRRALEFGMQVIRKKIIALCDRDLASTSCTGAGGGISGILAFTTGASIERGIEFLARRRGLEDGIIWSDIIFTGEGKYDDQTAQGKVVEHVTNLSLKHKKKIFVLCGQTNLPHSKLTMNKSNQGTQNQTNSNHIETRKSYSYKTDSELKVFSLLDYFSLNESMSNPAKCLQKLFSCILEEIV